ncbi:UDP-3-O-(3-hydroxymyristoyl)glucosamine N-acyltransferase [Zhongshania sp. BJYM1]|uniref:UDP-3-O-(3-hydroxymyristoyl)glucosamine N-acyltransferase n=1 Tax=Zhongshania aquatica TaxID=2965069 RepID=UPI0022B4E612|nr:UDP-3-O-(3-hydroxymyristoyl)glucosamine N-acyltransferase [Marortus sp. BJYM1]
MSGQKTFSLADVAAALELEFRGQPDTILRGIAPLGTAGPEYLSFLSNSKFKSQLESTLAGAVILHPKFATDFAGNCLLSVDPYLMYARASALFDPFIKPRSGVHPSAVVVAEDIHDSVSIAANCVIDEDVHIGEGTVIAPGVVIGRGSRIGKYCYIHANVTIYHGVSIGDESVVHSGVVIGGDGFGFAPGPHGWEKIHQLGGVQIGSRVEIGANSCIDRGALENTVIGDNVILDDQTMIAHNVVVGDGTAMAGCCQVAGSAVIGKNCTLAGNVGVVGHITIADNVHITARCMVSKSILQSGSYSGTFGVTESAEWRKNAARFSKLDELYRRVAFLEKQFKMKDEGEG